MVIPEPDSARGTCPVCGRSDVLIKGNGRLRRHNKLDCGVPDRSRPCPAANEEPC